MDDKKQRTGEISHVSRESSNVPKLWLPLLSGWIIFKWWFNLIDKNITMFFAVQKVVLPPISGNMWSDLLLALCNMEYKMRCIFTPKTRSIAQCVVLLHSSWAAPKFFHKSFIFSAMGQILSQQKWCLTQTKNLFLFPRDV